MDLGHSQSGARLHATYPRGPHLGGASGVTAPFVTYPDLYMARCVERPCGGRLEIMESASAGRTSPIDLSRRMWCREKMGMHLLDMQVAQGDLVDMVRRRSPSRPAR